MTLRKGGLGRGLEALLADDPSKAESAHQSKDASRDEMRSAYTAEQAGAMVGSIKNIQKEHRTLLEEAEALKTLMEEFESIVRADLS
jgi:hypothetical protein